jgi:hypothetical protein
MRFEYEDKCVKKNIPMRLITTFDLATAVFIEFTSLGLYFMGTICQEDGIIQKGRRNGLLTSNICL